MADYEKYSDGEPISNEMRCTRTGERWFRLSNGNWTNGALSGAWSEVERQYGEFEEICRCGGYDQSTPGGDYRPTPCRIHGAWWQKAVTARRRANQA